MQLEPAFLDRISDAGAKLRPARIAAGLGEERAVDLLDVDAVVDHLDASGQLEELSCGGFRFGVGAGISVLPRPDPLSRLVSRFATRRLQVDADGSLSSPKRFRLRAHYPDQPNRDYLS